MPPRRVQVVVTGRVQGVGFRAATRVEAARLGIAGWVRNRDDGAVELAAEGDAAAIAELVAWLRRGPPLSRIDAVEVEERPVRNDTVPFRVVR